MNWDNYEKSGFLTRNCLKATLNPERFFVKIFVTPPWDRCFLFNFSLQAILNPGEIFVKIFVTPSLRANLFCLLY